MKEKDGKEVPNCVPKANEGDNHEFSCVRCGTKVSRDTHLYDGGLCSKCEFDINHMGR